MTSVTAGVGGFRLARGYMRSTLWLTPVMFVGMACVWTLDRRWGLPFSDPRSVLLLVVGVVVVGTHVGVVRPRFTPSGPGPQVLAGVVLAGSLTAPVLAGLVAPAVTGWMLLITGVALAAWLATRGWRRRSVAGAGVACVVVIGIATVAGFPIPGTNGLLSAALLVTLLAPAATDIGTTWLVAVFDRLEEARRLAGELATERERTRIAAELHDVQGHSLHAIALHAELTERLVATDPDAAARHARTVRTLAADALGETRALVRGYRAADLAAELRNAAGLLRAAGAEAAVTGDPAAVPAGHAGLLGPVVREAATNVLRHSVPTRVAFTVRRVGERTELEVRNDGVPENLADGADGTVGPETDPDGGSGLAGMRDRIGRRGGRVEAGPDGPDGWRLAVVLLSDADDAEPVGGRR